MKLYVGGLSWNTTNESLRAAFEAYGPVTEAVVINDRETGRSRGFGFVTYETDADGQAGLEALNNSTLDGRTIRCDKAEERKRESRGGDRGDRGGGFRRDRF
ncbi:RNA-binding protein [Candidatus Poribacteria bacterium]|nr:RNA-binding protein [Candidatus Poribacteria bacterium]